MSGCCGQGPVIVSGAAATPRVDVETVLLCDVLADGTVAGVALVEPIYDTNSGARVGTRTVDPVTGAAYTPQGTLGPCSPDGCNATTSVLVLCDVAADGTATHFVRATTHDCEGALLGTLDRTLDGAAYTVTGTVGVCPAVPDCESPTTPTATIGLCLPDGTPIAVTVIRDCEGVITSEGWINLTTGAFSAGAPPVGTVACGDSQSVQVSGTFCDIDAGGEVVGLVLVEYSYAADGTIDSVRLVDAVTGATYTPTGTITVCPAGVEQPEQDLVQLCDVAGDGTSTTFIRDYRRDELGAITGHSDYLLDGTAYVPTGTVGVCHAECRNSSTVLVCDVPASSSTDIPTTITDSNVAAIGQGQFQNHPGPYTALWSGGTFIYPAGPGPAQQHLSATGQITADVSGCDGASGSLTISARVRNDGPDDGQAWDGALRLFRGTTLIASHNALEWAPVGWQGTLTVSAPVTAADIAAGDIRVSLILETYHLGAKQWTADQFDVTLELEGCEVTSATQFLRTLVTDCVTGEVVSTTDTTLDGDPYTVTGEVGQCTPSEPAECRNCEAVVLCDTADDAEPHSFLRTVCRDCTGAVISVLDTELDGAAPYAPVGTVGTCQGTPCQHCETFPMCDAGETQTVTLAQTLTDTDPTPYFKAADNLWKLPLPGGGQIFWDGGALHWPTEASPPPPAQQANQQQHHYIAALIAGAPFVADCPGVEPPTEVTITASAVIENLGPSTAVQTAALFRLHDGATQLAAGAQANMGAGSIRTITFTHTVTYEQWISGNLAVDLDAETYTQGAKGWETRQFTLTATAEVAGCPTTFLRTVCRDCEGAVTSTTDTLPDGTAYTPTGEVSYGACAEPEASSCQSCETLQLCDVTTPATITGAAGSGTLANGVTYTATGPNGGAVQPPNRSNSAGSWWGLHSFPFATTSPTKWTFSTPSTVEFSVYVRYYPTNPAISTAQLPAGLEVVSLPDGYTYNAATGVLTRTSDADPADPCTYVTDPQIEGAARFRTAGPVTSLTTAPAANSRVAACGIFFTYYAGALSVVPEGGPFLRHICRDCDGAVMSVTDTELDGTTAYTPTGTGGQCGTQTAEPAADVEPLLLCDTAADGTVTEFLRHYVYTDDSGTPTSHQDTALDGTTTYTPTGTVGQCQPAACEFTPICVRPSGRVEFLSNPAGDTSGVDADWTWGQSLTGPWFPTYRVGVFPGWTTVDPGTAEGTAHWIAPHPDSQLANTGQPGEGPAITAGTPDWYGRASFELPSFADPATIRISATALNADQLAVEWRLNGGAWQPVNSNHTQPPYTLAPTAVPGAQAGVNEIVVHVRETVFPTGAAGILLHVIAEYDVDASAYLEWTRVVCSDGSVYFLDDLGARQDALPDGSTIVPCPGAEACTTVQLRQLCDLGYTPQPPIPTPNGAFTRTGNVKVVGSGLYYSGGNATPNGVATLPVTGLIGDIPYTFHFSTSWAGAGVPNPALSNAIYLVEIFDGATVIASQQRNISNGAGTAPGYVDEAPVLFTAPASGAVTLRISDMSTGNGADRDLIVIPADVRAEALTVTTTPFLRAVAFGCDGQPTGTTDWELDGTTPYTVAGAVAACEGDAAITEACAKQVIERCGCDDTTGDGLGDVMYTELWAIDPCGTDEPVLLGAYLDGDPAQPYTPVAPVECTVEDSTPAPLSTGVRAVTGTAAQNLAGAFPGLQSVTLTVLAGAVNVTMTDGAAVPVPAGLTMTWSVAKDEDSALSAATFAGAAAAAQYLLNYTFR